MKYTVKENMVSYAADTSEEVDLLKGVIVEDCKVYSGRQEKSYEYVRLRIAQSKWDIDTATREQLSLYFKQPRTYHDFYPQVELPNRKLVTLLSGEYAGVHVWVDSSYLIATAGFL